MPLTRLNFLFLTLCLAGSWALDLDFHPEVDSSHRGPRSVRDTRKSDDEGGWWKARCCGDVSVYNPEFVEDKVKKITACHEETRKKNITEVIVDPFLESYSCEKINENKAKADCNVDCVYRKYGIIDGSGNVNVEKLKELYNWFLKEDWRKQLAYKAADKCVNIRDDDTGSSVSKCSPKAFNLKHCLWKEIIVTCPTQYQLKSEYCDHARDVLSKQ